MPAKQKAKKAARGRKANPRARKAAKAKPRKARRAAKRPSPTLGEIAASTPA